MNQISNNKKECQFGTLCLNDPPEMGDCSTRYRVYKDGIRQLQHTNGTDIYIDYSHLFFANSKKCSSFMSSMHNGNKKGKT